MRSILLVCLLLVACDSATGTGGTVVVPQGVGLDLVASGLASPVHLTAPAGDARLFIVEQPGRIRIVEDGALLAQPFLDITDRVLGGGERGLLGLAFHPAYATNGFFYVNYIDASGNTRVERFQVTTDPNVADPESGTLVLTFSQPFSNHNGGLVVFGPDGMLWIGSGDGGSGGDPQGHGQNTSTLLGALLRIDVDGGEPYAIPADNPFVAGGGAPEIWAYGLRNPWRFSFDAETGLLYVADVGQNRIEEVNVEPADAAGLNYGWAIMEGTECFGATTCDQTGLTLPALEYLQPTGCAVVGGHVYRGNTIQDLQGRYVFGDHCAGWVRSFLFTQGTAGSLTDLVVGDIGRINSFGEDGARELYVLTTDGRVYRFVPAEP
jgi:glucose/arabinose dehydrogenase